MDGFLLQIAYGALITIELALSALSLGLIIGLIGAFIHLMPKWFRYPFVSILFIIRSLPELLILFFIYFASLSKRYLQSTPCSRSIPFKQYYCGN